METLNNDCLGLIQACLGPKTWGCWAQTNRQWRHFLQSSSAYVVTKQIFQQNLEPTSRFISLCQAGRCRLAKHYYEELTTGNLYDFRTRVFTQICMDGHLEVARWLLDQGVKIYHSYLIPADHSDSDSDDSDDEDSDEEEINQIRMSQYANPIEPRPISLGDVFRMTCENGHLEVARWLWFLSPTIDLHMMNDHIFRMVCMKGQLEVAKRLWSLDGQINLHHNNDYIFMSTCVAGRLDVAKWLSLVSRDQR